jgi:putative ABC transport system permease protein
MLLLKMWRDVLARKGQFAGLIVVVGLGISTFVAFQAGYLDLTRSVERADRELRFADFSISVSETSRIKAAAVVALPGVLAAEGRLVQDVSLEVDQQTNRTAVARVVGLPNTGRPAVNDLLLLAGAWPRRGGSEAILHTKFAQETGTRPGADLTLLMGRQHKHVRVVGIAASPEYMYAVPEKGALPSPGEFAVLFMRADDAERLLGRPGVITDVAVIVSPEASVASVVREVEDELGRSRVVASTLRADQPSSFMLAEEIEQNRVMALFLPAVILAISASSLFIALSRLVTSQRREIGLEKALGYSDRQILGQYLSFALVVAGFGAVLGFLGGDLLARVIAAQYVDMLGVPFLEHHVYPEIVAGAVAISSLACVLAGIVPAWRSSHLPPAQAMYADPNAALSGGKVPLLERALSPMCQRRSLCGSRCATSSGRNGEASTRSSGSRSPCCWPSRRSPCSTRWTRCSTASTTSASAGTSRPSSLNRSAPHGPPKSRTGPAFAGCRQHSFFLQSFAPTMAPTRAASPAPNRQPTSTASRSSLGRLPQTRSPPVDW